MSKLIRILLIFLLSMICRCRAQEKNKFLVPPPPPIFGGSAISMGTPSNIPSQIQSPKLMNPKIRPAQESDSKFSNEEETQKALNESQNQSENEERGTERPHESRDHSDKKKVIEKVEMGAENKEDQTEETKHTEAVAGLLLKAKTRLQSLGFTESQERVILAELTNPDVRHPGIINPRTVYSQQKRRQSLGPKRVTGLEIEPERRFPTKETGVRGFGVRKSPMFSQPMQVQKVQQVEMTRFPGPIRIQNKVPERKNFHSNENKFQSPQPPPPVMSPSSFGLSSFGSQIDYSSLMAPYTNLGPIQNAFRNLFRGGRRLSSPLNAPQKLKSGPRKGIPVVNQMRKRMSIRRTSPIPNASQFYLPSLAGSSPNIPQNPAVYLSELRQKNSNNINEQLVNAINSERNKYEIQEIGGSQWQEHISTEDSTLYHSSTETVVQSSIINEPIGTKAPVPAITPKYTQNGNQGFVAPESKISSDIGGSRGDPFGEIDYDFDTKLRTATAEFQQELISSNENSPTAQPTPYFSNDETLNQHRGVEHSYPMSEPFDEKSSYEHGPEDMAGYKSFVVQNLDNIEEQQQVPESNDPNVNNTFIETINEPQAEKYQKAEIDVNLDLVERGNEHGSKTSVELKNEPEYQPIYSGPVLPRKKFNRFVKPQGMSAERDVKELREITTIKVDVSVELDNPKMAEISMTPRVDKKIVQTTDDPIKSIETKNYEWKFSPVTRKNKKELNSPEATRFHIHKMEEDEITLRESILNEIATSTGIKSDEVNSEKDRKLNKIAIPSTQSIRSPLHKPKNRLKAVTERPRMNRGRYEKIYGYNKGVEPVRVKLRTIPSTSPMKIDLKEGQVKAFIRADNTAKMLNHDSASSIISYIKIPSISRELPFPPMQLKMPPTRRQNVKRILPQAQGLINSFRHRLTARRDI